MKKINRLYVSWCVGIVCTLYILFFGVCQDLFAMSCQAKNMQVPDLSEQVAVPEGQAWVATKVFDEPAKAGMDSAILVRFQVNDKGVLGISGYDGCNFFFGSYAADASRVEFGQLGATRRMCAPDPVLEAQTQAVYDLMEKPVDIVREGDTLEWWQDGQRRIVWQMANDPFFKPQAPAK